MVLTVIGTAIAALALSACGTEENYYDENKAVVGAPDPSNDDAKPRLSGNFVRLNGEEDKVQNYASKPIVLFIGSATCQTCSEEAVKVRDYVNNNNLTLENVNLITVLQGDGVEELDFWQNDNFDEPHNVPWTIGDQSPGELLGKYCPKQQTPCTIVQTPKDGIVFTEHGLVPIETLQQYSGEWK